MSYRRIAPFGNSILSFLQKRYLQTICSPSPVVSAASPINNDAVSLFLKSHGFSDAQVAKLVSNCPRILRSSVDVLRPKVEFLVGSGFAGPLLPELLIKCPRIWRRGLTSHLMPAVDLLKKYLGTDQRFVSAVSHASWILTTSLNRTQNIIDLLISERVPQQTVGDMLARKPGMVMNSLDKTAHALSAVRELGFPPESPMFVAAFASSASLSDSVFEKKAQLLKSLGWSEEDAKLAFKRYPTCFTCSNQKIKSVFDFYVNTWRMDTKSIIAHPQLLSYSIDKRLRPRYTVLKLLESRGVIKFDRNTVGFALKSNEIFLKKYVDEYLDQVPNLMAIYCGSMTDSQ